MNIVTLGWRNIWRNKRRTYITVASVLFAVLFAIVMRAFQEGTYSRAIENMVRMVSGHVQIHAAGYWDDQVIDNVFLANDSLINSVRKLPDVEYVFPRLQYFSFASSGSITREAIIMGMQPTEEEPIMQLRKKITWGKSIDESSTGVLVGEALAQSLGLIEFRDSIVTGSEGTDTLRTMHVLTDTIILLGQGYHGASAAGKYHIDGIVHLPIPDLDKRAVYMPLAQAQYFFNAPGMLTSINIQLSDGDAQDATVASLATFLNKDEYEIMPWQEMQKELMQQIESDKGSGKITIWLLYLIIGFGILGTIIMMATERKHEFGVMIAIGMQKTLLCKQVAVELLYMGIIGVGAGSVASLPILGYFYINPIQFTGEMAKMYESYGWEAIMPISFAQSIFVEQAIVVFLLFVLSAIYAMVQIMKLDVKTAIHK